MKMKNRNKFCKSIVLVVFTLLFSSCVKQDFDAPAPQNLDPSFTANTTIKQLWDLWNNRDLTINADTLKMTGGLIIEGIVISDDSDGNIYKELYIQDSTGGIPIEIDQYSLFTKYPAGQKILVKCDGLYLGAYGGMVQIGSIYADEFDKVEFGRIQGDALLREHLFKKSGGTPIIPDTITIADLITKPLATLVVFKDVQVATADTGNTFADAATKATKNRTIEDANSGTTVIRNSGYSSFAGQKMPTGSGNLTAIISKFNSDFQLFINDADALAFNKARLGAPGGGGGGGGTTVLDKTFDDNSLTSGGWTAQSVSGTAAWSVAVFSGKYYGNINGNSNDNEDWLISPTINLSTYTSANLSFKTATKYTGPALEVYISTNYTGSGAPSTASWTKLTATLSSGNFTWTESGSVSLASYLSSSVYIAFKYTASTTGGAHWEVDNIKITAQ